MVKSLHTLARSSMDLSWCFSAVALVTTMASLFSALDGSSTPTLVINGEADVLRDEGEAFAAKLRRAGVEVTQVRYAGIVHDFVMVNSLHDTSAAKAAVAQAVSHLKAALSA